MVVRGELHRLPGTSMKPCPEYLDELALAAGGDLPVEEERLVLTHAEACEPCAAFLAGLTADQGVVARAALQREAFESFESLIPAVMARVATETHERTVRAVLEARAGHSGNSRQPGTTFATPATFARLAAAMVVVVGAGLLGMAALQPGELRPENVTAAILPHQSGLHLGEDAGSAAGPQMAIRRLAGEAMELSWAGDGREGGESGAGRPYTVLASANPRSFVGAKEVEVAGHSLVTDLPLPATRGGDRKITYFRIQ